MQHRNWETGKKNPENLQGGGTVSRNGSYCPFARQIMDGEGGLWEGEDDMDSGVWEFEAWKIMSEQCTGWGVIKMGLRKNETSKG